VLAGHSTFDHVLRELETHLSPINARGALERAVARMGVRPTAMTSAHVPGLVRELRVALRLFLDPKVTSQVLQAIESLGSGPVSRGGTIRIEIRGEPDVLAARTAARNLCDTLGARSFAAQKILTIVSELARNMASYSIGGIIDLRSHDHRLHIDARDRGPGITNLDDILGGRYRSRTGLGLGILGVKRLGERFVITTSPQGTEVLVEVRL